MTSTIKFNRPAIDRLPPARPSSRDDYSDPRHPGLVLRVTATGQKSWAVRKKVHGKALRVTLGAWPDVQIEQAWKLARQAIGQLAEGRNPTAEKREQQNRGATLEDVFDEYLKVKPLKPRTRADYEREFAVSFRRRSSDKAGKGRGWKNVSVTTYSTLADKPVADITGEDVVTWYSKRSAVSAARANIGLRLIKALLSFAKRRLMKADGTPLLLFNAADVVADQRVKVRVRDEYLKPEQLEKWWTTLEAEITASPNSVTATACRLFQFIALTGVRLEEACRLTWGDIDTSSKTFHIADPKNDRPVTMPLAQFLADMLKRIKPKDAKSNELVFQNSDGGNLYTSIGNYARAIAAECEFHWTPHQLRRGYGTYLDMLDTPLTATKALLNHAMSDDITTRVYLQRDIERLRKHSKRVERFILGHAKVKQSTVVTLKPAGAKAG